MSEIHGIRTPPPSTELFELTNKVLSEGKFNNLTWKTKRLVEEILTKKSENPDRLTEIQNSLTAALGQEKKEYYQIMHFIRDIAESLNIVPSADRIQNLIPEKPASPAPPPSKALAEEHSSTQHKHIPSPLQSHLKELEELNFTLNLKTENFFFTNMQKKIDALKRSTDPNKSEVKKSLLTTINELQDLLHRIKVEIKQIREISKDFDEEKLTRLEEFVDNRTPLLNEMLDELENLNEEVLKDEYILPLSELDFLEIDLLTRDPQETLTDAELKEIQELLDKIKEEDKPPPA